MRFICNTFCYVQEFVKSCSDDFLDFTFVTRNGSVKTNRLFLASIGMHKALETSELHLDIDIQAVNVMMSFFSDPGRNNEHIFKQVRVTFLRL